MDVADRLGHGDAWPLVVVFRSLGGKPRLASAIHQQLNFSVPPSLLKFLGTYETGTGTQKLWSQPLVFEMANTRERDTETDVHSRVVCVRGEEIGWRGVGRGAAAS